MSEWPIPPIHMCACLAFRSSCVCMHPCASVGGWVPPVYEQSYTGGPSHLHPYVPIHPPISILPSFLPFFLPFVWTGSDWAVWSLIRLVHNRAHRTLVTSPQLREQMTARGVERVHVWAAGVDCEVRGGGGGGEGDKTKQNKTHAKHRKGRGGRERMEGGEVAKCEAGEDRGAGEGSRRRTWKRRWSRSQSEQRQTEDAHTPLYVCSFLGSSISASLQSVLVGMHVCVYAYANLYVRMDVWVCVHWH
eukprot:GHVU01040753.1.p1 GENE.GHVU01040753.1~~GHVU01040753.1.p1  ORF type:complete len:247 (+),score=33.69 GHVU01040753.1:197-937(+)